MTLQEVMSAIREWDAERKTRNRYAFPDDQNIAWNEHVWAYMGTQMNLVEQGGGIQHTLYLLGATLDPLDPLCSYPCEGGDDYKRLQSFLRSNGILTLREVLSAAQQ